MDNLATMQPLRFKQLFEDAESFGLPELPLTCFSIEQAEDAFTYMQAATHVGKVLVTQKLFGCNGTYVISGGLGYIGLLAAKALVEHGARKIVLLSSSRSSLPDDWALAVRPEVVKCDLGDRAQVLAVFDRYRDVRGVIHAAGALSAGTLQSLSVADFDKVYHPKVQGARNLDECSRGLSLDFFVLFSSIASGFGGPGQANYAAANGFLDSLAQRRVDEGLTGLSVRWGAWSGGGMSLFRGTHERAARSGYLPLDATLGLDILLRLILHDAPSSVVTVCPLLPSKLQKSPYFDGFSLHPATTSLAEGTDWTAYLLSIPGILQRRSAIREKFVTLLSSLDVHNIDGATPWSEAGLDSLSMVELRNLLSKALGDSVPLSRTVLYDFPNLDALVHHIDAALFQRVGGEVVVDGMRETMHNRDSFLVSEEHENGLAPVESSQYLPGLMIEVQNGNDIYHDCLVCLRAGDLECAPIVLLYGAWGVGYGVQLLRLLSDSQPVYTTQAPEYTSPFSFDSIKARAQHHMSVLTQKFGLTRKLHMIGYSFGACLGFEIARLFEEAGIKYTLTMLDPVPCTVNPLKEFSQLALKAKAADFLTENKFNFFELFSEKIIQNEMMINIKILEAGQDNIPLARKLQHLSHVSAKLATGSVQYQKEYDAGSGRLKHATVFVLSKGLQFFASIFSTDYDDSVYGWSSRFDSCTRMDAEGGHFDFFMDKKNVKMLADHILQLVSAT